MCQDDRMTQGKALTQENRTLGSMLRVPFEAMLEHNWRIVHEMGFEDIRVAHGAVFRNISSEGSRVTDLAARAGMTKQSMAELVAYLQERGYVELEPDPDDRRGKLVKLTETGWAVFRTLSEASNGFEAQCSRLVGEAKWEELKSLLRELVEALELRPVNGR